RRTTGRATTEPPRNTRSKQALSTEPRETALSRGAVPSTSEQVRRTCELCRRQFDGKSRPFAGPGAHGHPPAHPRDELARDVEAQAAAADTARERRIEAVELLEDPILLAGRDSEPAVAHGERHEARRAAELHRHLSAVG